MKTLTPHMTVAEIAAGRPASVKVFEQHRVDFCCGGKAPLEQACRTLGLDPAALIAEIEESELPAWEARDWNAVPLCELIDHILSVHHRYLKTELPRLAATVKKIEANHQGKYPEIPRLAAVLHALRAE